MTWLVLLALAWTPDETAQIRSASRGADHLYARPACRRIYPEAAGDDLVRTMRYRRPRPGKERDRCRSAAALAYRWDPEVVLCRGFFRMARRHAVVAVLHEALHVAGVPESARERPLPGAPTSLEITRRVRVHCR